MNFRERERSRLIALRDDLFSDPGQGSYAGIPREFVLAGEAGNLWPGIREDALAYFEKHRIVWSGGSRGLPTGHLLSSQIACVNHLYSVRQRADLATAVLRAIDPDIIRAEILDEGHVEFEFIGQCQRLQDRGFTRGAHCTSVDACMIGATARGERRAFLIEWKYTEKYAPKDQYIPQRAKVYDHHLAAADSPFRPHALGALYYEPFYQLMRQTLLGWLVSKHSDYGCTSYRHVHVVPAANAEFHLGITAPGLRGSSVSGAWASVLRQPERYISTTPADFLRPILGERDTRSLTTYLQARYWAGG